MTDKAGKVLRAERFLAEAERQKMARLGRMRLGLAEERARPAYDSPLDFEPESPLWVAALSLVRDEYKDRTSHIVLRPYPSKSPGAWRVELAFSRGPYCGVEYYVYEEEIAAAFAGPSLPLKGSRG